MYPAKKKERRAKAGAPFSQRNILPGQTNPGAILLQAAFLMGDEPFVHREQQPIFAFAGELRGWEADRKLDEGIVGARWLTLDEVKATQARHRSPLILRCIEDLLAGKRYPLDLLVHYD